MNKNTLLIAAALIGIGIYILMRRKGPGAARESGPADVKTPIQPSHE